MRTSRAASVALASLVLAACGAAGSTTGTRTSAGAGPSGSSTVPTVTRTTTATSTTSGSGIATSTTTKAAGPALCRSVRIALSFLGQQGATGHGELGFALRNTGSSNCSTIGYPGILFLDRSGGSLATVPSHTTHDFFGSSPLRALVVAPGQTVSFRLGVTHTVGGSSAGCTTAHGLQVIPPNDTAGLRVTIPDGGAAECGTATVSPLRPGDSAYP